MCNSFDHYVTVRMIQREKDKDNYISNFELSLSFIIPHLLLNFMQKDFFGKKIQDETAFANLLSCNKKIYQSINKLKLTYDLFSVTDFLKLKYEDKQKVKIMLIDKNEIGKIKKFPPHLKELHFDNNFNQILSEGLLPESLSYITFGHAFNHPLKNGVLPSSLLELTFDKMFDQKLQVGSLPGSLLYLRFGYFYDQPLDKGVLPSSLLNLTFGAQFNQKLNIGALPASLLDLTFGSSFDQEFKIGVLPSSLLHITFGFAFNQPLSAIDILPSSLLHLSFDMSYNQPLDLIELDLLKSVILSRNYKNKITVSPSTIIRKLF